MQCLCEKIIIDHYLSILLVSFFSLVKYFIGAFGSAV